MSTDRRWPDVAARCKIANRYDRRRSRFRNVLRWILPGGLAAVLLLSWFLFFSGGMMAVVGWTLLVSTGAIVQHAAAAP